MKISSTPRLARLPRVTGPSVLGAEDTRENVAARRFPQRNNSRMATMNVVAFDGADVSKSNTKFHKHRFRALEADGRPIDDFPREREAAQAVTSRASHPGASRDAS